MRLGLLANPALLCVSVLQVRSQGVTEELKCLSLLNALHKDPDIPEQLAQLLGEPCMKLAEGIKAYISKVRGSLLLLHPPPHPPAGRLRTWRERVEVGSG